jgi:hypothetical protein
LEKSQSKNNSFTSRWFLKNLCLFDLAQWMPCKSSRGGLAHELAFSTSHRRSAVDCKANQAIQPSTAPANA